MSEVEYRQKKKVEAICSKKTRSLGYRLTRNYGIGYKTKKYVLEGVGLNCRVYLSKFRKRHNSAVGYVCRTFFVGGSLKMHVQESLKFLKKINSYRGDRHKSNYPSRGQRTHTNGKTKKKFRGLV
jgi:small subunit ribosomal protein S13